MKSELLNKENEIKLLKSDITAKETEFKLIKSSDLSSKDNEIIFIRTEQIN